MSIKVGFLSLSPEISEMVRSVCQELPSEVEVLIEEINPLDDQAPYQAAAQLETSCDVIVCRAGTRVQVTPKVEIPVVEFPYTYADVLDALYLASSKGKQIFLILYRAQDLDLGHWPNLLKIELTKVLIDSRQEIRSAVRKAKQVGAVVVGVTLTVEYASSLNLCSVLIRSGRETIRQCLERAVDIVKVTHQEKERAAHLQALLDFTHEGIIFLKEENKIAYVNRAAVEILKIPHQNLIGKKITDILDSSSEPDLGDVFRGRITGPLLGKLVKVDDLSIMANIVPITAGTKAAGTVIAFFEASRLQSIEHSFRRQMARRAMRAKFTLNDVIGESKAIAHIKEQTAVFAITDSTVAIYGESGVGKELFAQSIHNLSVRGQGPFVAVNCSALPKELMESELFGYEEGAFTGAKKGGKVGLFELAHGGTIFLDEVGNMPLELQSKILRVIQEKEVTRLGGANLIPIDVRIIIATNCDLQEAVKRGEFRLDLYFRLNVLPLHIPSLRERPEDIPQLFEHFIRTFSRKLGRQIRLEHLSNLLLLQEHTWPGNVRELMNFAERFVALAGQGSQLDELLKTLLQESRGEFKQGPDFNPLDGSSWNDTWQKMEKNFLKQLLVESQMSKTALAKSLGISRTTLWKKLEKNK